MHSLILPGSDNAVPSPSMGPLHNSMSVLSQDQIDHASPFAPPPGFPPTRMTVLCKAPSMGEG